MNSENIEKVTNQAIKQLITALNEGRSETLAHELAHEMMHRDERRSSTSKRSRETEAEAVAFVVCHGIGLETGSASQDYIQLYEGDAKLLTNSLEHIQKAATQILNAIGAEFPSAPPA